MVSKTITSYYTAQEMIDALYARHKELLHQLTQTGMVVGSPAYVITNAQNSEICDAINYFSNPKETILVNNNYCNKSYANRNKY